VKRSLRACIGIFTVFIGGVPGLSISNAIFVDARTADNTARVELMVGALHEEIRQLREELRRTAL
jgi:hypothetical protein